MELLSTKMRTIKDEGKKFHFRHVNFEMPIRYPSRYVDTRIREAFREDMCQGATPGNSQAVDLKWPPYFSF